MRLVFHCTSHCGHPGGRVLGTGDASSDKIHL